MSIETIQDGIQSGKICIKQVNRASGSPNTFVTGVSAGEVKDIGAENLFKNNC